MGLHDAQHLAHHITAFDFRQQDGIGTAGGDGGEVGMSPWCRQGIDAHDQLALAIAAGMNRVAYHLPSDLLALGRDGIFEVKN
jgi:hypothetical protein